MWILAGASGKMWPKGEPNEYRGIQGSQSTIAHYIKKCLERPMSHVDRLFSMSVDMPTQAAEKQRKAVHLLFHFHHAKGRSDYLYFRNQLSQLSLWVTHWHSSARVEQGMRKNVLEEIVHHTARSPGHRRGLLAGLSDRDCVQPLPNNRYHQCTWATVLPFWKQCYLYFIFLPTLYDEWRMDYSLKLRDKSILVWRG